MKRVLVTGLSGFIGSNALEFLLENGYEVHAFSSLKRQNTKNVKWYNVDLVKEKNLEAILQQIKPSHLLHLAWDVTPGKYMCDPSNYDWLISSINLLRSFKENGGQRVVIAGTQFEYNSNCPYSASKKALLEVLKSFDISYAWGRIFYLFGENENDERLVPYVINSLKEKKEVNCLDGEQIRDFMYVKDVARAFVEILNSDVQGDIDIGLGKGIKIKDLVFKIADKFDLKELVNINPSNNTVQSVIADVSRLRDEVGFIPKFDIDQALISLIKNQPK